MRRLTPKLLLTILTCLPLGGVHAAGTSPAAAGNAPQAVGPVKLSVDVTDAARHLFHATESMPVTPGPLTLWYPKYIPGEHGPTGPVVDLAGLKFKANGKTLQWQRDPYDMYTFHLKVPKGADTLQISLDFLSPVGSGDFTAGVSSTANLVDLNWNQVALYPKVHSTHKLKYNPSIKLPSGWDFASALRVAHKNDNSIDFKPVTFNNLVDAPLIAGKYFKKVNLSPHSSLHEYLNIVADNQAALGITKQETKHFSNLVTQAKALFGSHHYHHYDFLLTLSNHTAHFGLEHHQSSDDRVGAESLIDPQHALLAAGLLPHEFTHSWNGKFRRPAKLWQPNFEKPENTKMLWVYEGLTQYFGSLVLTTRSGLWSQQQARQALALTAAAMDHRPGREWRPLIDTTVSAQILYGAPGAWGNWRRRADFYPEGQLIWLSVDTKIRKLSHGKKSLNDFAKLFYGMNNGSIVTKTYTFDDVANTLNKIQPYGWTKFLRTRLDRTQYHAPLQGITRGGWALVYTDKPTHYQKTYELIRKFSDRMFGIGLQVSHDGKIGDVLWNGPAYNAGVGAGMKLVAINGEKFTPKVLDRAITAAKQDKQPLHLLVESQDTYRTYDVDYHDGLKYPHLVRQKGKTDYLSRILKPLPTGKS